MHRFEKLWATWCAANYRGQRQAQRRAEAPEVKVKLHLFLGLRLAHAQGKPEAAGRWYDERRAYSFEWGRKRAMVRILWETPLCIRTYPRLGGPGVVSVPHGKNLEAVRDFEALRARLDEQPDAVNLSPPGRE